MAKDSYWFKHDSSAGRGLKMRKMAHIYGHWGKGVYWDVVEILRDQEGYKFEADESSLQLLCDLIGGKDDIKFLNWFKDSLKIGLFSVSEGYFFCPPLSENMIVWETKKENGKKGGRKPKETEIKPNVKPNLKHKRREDKIRKENIIEDEKSALSILKSNKEGWETIEMQNKKRFGDWDKMLELYNYKVDEEKLEYDYKVLKSRLMRWMSNWETNKKETITGIDPKTGRYDPTHNMVF